MFGSLTVDAIAIAAYLAGLVIGYAAGWWHRGRYVRPEPPRRNTWRERARIPVVLK